jgi:peptidoglycan lytic transglycosylase
MYKYVVLFFLNLLLVSCGVRDGAPSHYSKRPDEIKNAVPTNEPVCKSCSKSYTVLGKTYDVMKSSNGFVQQGDASWYGTKFHGRKTSSGETYDMFAMTAAHKTLPLPTYVEVTHRENGRKIIVKVNDRGPFHEGRIIDLSYAAAKKLGVASTGTGPVEIKVINTSTLDLNTDNVILPPSSGGDGKIHVQVAAMGTVIAAEEMATKLRNKRFRSVRVHMLKTDNGKLYRVRIGPIPSTDLAYRVLKELNDIGHESARVIVD